MNIEEQFRYLKRGVVEIITEDDFRVKLAKQQPLNIKLGVDPTAPDIHLGFSVVMRKLRAFQELGHRVILIVGDYTATVGDPSGKNKTRPMLSHEQVMNHAETYKKQFFRIVDESKTRVVYNGDWFRGMTFQEVTLLMSQITVAQMLEREDFQNRYRAGRSISLHEFLYPMMQAWDSVKIEADVELGGTDQKFNILRGREIQKNAGQEPQAGMLLPILIGTDGKEKMSKSLGNVVGICESPQSMFHKLYNLPDAVVGDYLTLLTDMPEQEIHEKQSQIKAGSCNPNEVKTELALDIVAQYHGIQKAREAEQAERKIHAGKALPDNLPEFLFERGEYWVPKLMVESGLCTSNGEGRRFIQNGGVRFDRVKVDNPKSRVKIAGEHVLQVGKRRFVRIKAK
jgi:tyrosyl-tRNA synthetase